MTTTIQSYGPIEVALDHTAQYVEAFNSGDVAAVEELYTDDAVAVWEPGLALTGDARREQLAEFLAQKPIMTATVREAYVTEDTALQVVDWTIDIPDVGGEPQHLEGVGLDVLVRGADGTWRIAVDNPFGDTRDGDDDA